MSCKILFGEEKKKVTLRIVRKVLYQSGMNMSMSVKSYLSTGGRNWSENMSIIACKFFCCVPKIVESGKSGIYLRKYALRLKFS